MEKRLVLLKGAYNVRDLGGILLKVAKKPNGVDFIGGMVFKD